MSVERPTWDSAPGKTVEEAQESEHEEVGKGLEAAERAKLSGMALEMESVGV